jgi:hypothetical protein
MPSKDVIRPGQRSLPPPTPLVNQYKLYDAGVQQNGEDYTGLMAGYKDLISRANSQPNIGTPAAYVPQTQQYSQSRDLTDAIGNLKGLADTGGYSGANIADIRERGISPIRAIYADANRDIDRNRALSGGYSPNYAAVKAKMARELSERIAGQVTKVNADIAQNVAGNRLAAASPYANVTAGQSDLKNQIGSRNADTLNDASKFNIEMPFKVQQANNNNTNTTLQALDGAKSLYGTTPALASTFGNQAMNYSQQQAAINNQGQSNALAAAQVAAPAPYGSKVVRRF